MPEYPHRSSIAVLSGLALCLAAGPTGAQQNRALSIDFEAMQAKSAPAGFSSLLTGKGRAPAWQVLEDPSAPAGPKVVAETSKDRTDYRFPLLVLDGFKARNVQVTVAFKAVSGQVDQAAGAVVRLKDADNYYVARANALEDNVNLYKVVGGKRSEITGKKIKVPSGHWQTLGLKIQDDRLQVSFNGTVLFDARDGTFKDSGRVGLWTKADSMTEFDDLHIEPLP